MFRLILPAIICLAAPAIAAPKPDCPGDERAQCDKVMACLEDDRVFTGRAQPNFGPITEVTGVIDGHVPCAGELMAYNRPFAGELTLTCSDSSAFQVQYLGDFAPGIRFGQGTGHDKNGVAVRIWVGHGLPATCPAD